MWLIRERGGKDDSKVFGLNNWVDVMSFIEKENPRRGFFLGGLW